MYTYKTQKTLAQKKVVILLLVDNMFVFISKQKQAIRRLSQTGRTRTLSEGQ